MTLLIGPHEVNRVSREIDKVSITVISVVKKYIKFINFVY